MALFKIEKGLDANLFSKRPDTHEGWCYFTTDEGKMYIDIQDGTGTAKNPKYRVALNAATADVAQKLLTENVGSATRPVYFDGGVPVECVDFLPLTAGPDKKLTGPLGLKKDIGYGTELPEDGFEGQIFFLDDQTPDLPLGGTTGQVLVKNSNDDKDASWTSEFTGNAASANMLNSNAGYGDKPVYFDGGVPVACDDILNVSVKGSAAKWTTARDFTISDGTNTGSTVSVDGTNAITLKLPTTIKATLKGNADTATSASEAAKLTSDAGDVNTPVYFDGGIPVSCGTIKNDIESDNIVANSLTANTIISHVENSNIRTEINGHSVSVVNFNEQTLSMMDASGVVGIVDLTNSTAAGVTKNAIGFGEIDTSTGEIIDLTVALTPTGLRGNADTATYASEAGKLVSDKVGNATLPVYFDGGLPVACNNNLDVNITGTSSAWTTARNFTISDGTNTGTPSSVNGSDNVTIKLPTTIKATLKGNADTATNANAANKLNSNNGSSTVPVYFDEGLPVACDSLSLDTTGSAAKWTNQVNFTVSSSDGTGAGEVSKVDGSADVDIKLPTTIKANLTGTASEATHAVSADRLGDLNVGSANTPVYFDNGVPVDCTSPLALDTNGNAATAAKWQEDRTFVITDADGTHSGENVTVNGTEDITLTLPVEIKANLKGTADLATALTENAGTATRPVYFDGGIPTNCDDTLDVNITGNANTAAIASKLSVNAGDTNTPVYFIDGIPKACTSLDLSTSGNAGSANKLNTSAGDAKTPVYFENGVPKACTQVLPLSAGENYKLTGSLGLTQDVMYGSEIPESGFDGQLFFLTEDSEDFPIYVPKGGNSGEVLIKNSDTNGDISWKELVALPRGGDAGHVLIKNSITDGDASWKELVALPKGGGTGQVLIKNSDDDGDGKWSSYFAGTSNASNTLFSNNTLGLEGCLQYFQTSDQNGANDLPENSWYHVLKMNHGIGDEYYKRLLAFDFHSNKIMTTYKNGASTDHTTRWKRLWMEGDAITGAVWNDYAECRESDCKEFGYVLMENGDDTLSKTTERLSHFAGISSDTWGFSQGETDKAKTPIAVAGRVLAYPYQDRNNYKPGDCVCAAPGGTVDIMTREEVINWPDRIVGTVSCVPEYEEWGGGENADRSSVKVNGRIWIKVK